MNARMLSAGVLAVAVLAFVGSAAVAAHTYEGTVVSADSAQLVLEMGTEQHSFLVTKNTKVTLDGQPVEPEKLGTGHLARVTANKQEGMFVATRIEARAAKPDETRLPNKRQQR